MDTIILGISNRTRLLESPRPLALQKVFSFQAHASLLSPHGSVPLHLGKGGLSPVPSQYTSRVMQMLQTSSTFPWFEKSIIGSEEKQRGMRAIKLESSSKTGSISGAISGTSYNRCVVWHTLNINILVCAVLTPKEAVQIIHQQPLRAAGSIRRKSRTSQNRGSPEA